MATTYVSDWTGLEIDEAVGLVLNNYKSVMPVGIEWDSSSSSPALKHIDLNGNEISLDTSDFDAHTLFGNIGRCTIDPATNVPVFGSNARGDGLTLDGSTGNVMVRIPKFYVKHEISGTVRRWYVSPTALAGFSIHPAFVQRGGTEQNEIYISAYEASGFLDVATFKLRSITGAQPVTGGVSYTNLPNAGRFTIDDAELYAGNIGSGYGCLNIWTSAAIQLLFYTEYANFDSQTVLGRGVSNLASGVDFAGLNTGADSIDTAMATNGTGSGTGTDGETPISWRGLENLWGNVWKFGIGYNAVDTEYRIANRDGSGTLSGNLTAGNYEVSTVAPITSNGFISNVESEPLLLNLFVPSGTLASSSTYFCDYTYSHELGEINIVRIGGYWVTGLTNGIAGQESNSDNSASARQFGGRFEYIPQ